MIKIRVKIRKEKVNQKKPTINKTNTNYTNKKPETHFKRINMSTSPTHTAKKATDQHRDQILTDQKNPPSSKNVSKKRKSPTEVEEEPSTLTAVEERTKRKKLEEQIYHRDPIMLLFAHCPQTHNSDYATVSKSTNGDFMEVSYSGENASLIATKSNNRCFLHTVFERLESRLVDDYEEDRHIEISVLFLERDDSEIALVGTIPKIGEMVNDDTRSEMRAIARKKLGYSLYKTFGEALHNKLLRDRLQHLLLSYVFSDFGIQSQTIYHDCDNYVTEILYSFNKFIEGSFRIPSTHTKKSHIQYFLFFNQDRH
jgi:hypothetical protein